jgi:hypothetical protein
MMFSVMFLAGDLVLVGMTIKLMEYNTVTLNS